jgi:catalase
MGAEGRKIGCLIADGTDGKVVAPLTAAVCREKADFAIVAPKVGGAKDATSKLIEANFQLAGGSSVLFDAVFLALSSDSAAMLSQYAAALAWVLDACAHCKIIGATEGGAKLLQAAGVLPDEGVVSHTQKFIDAGAKGRVVET